MRPILFKFSRQQTYKATRFAPKFGTHEFQYELVERKAGRNISLVVTRKSASSDTFIATVLNTLMAQSSYRSIPVRF